MIDLPPLNEQDSIAALLATMSKELSHLPSDEFGDSYVRIRAILRRHPLLQSKLPEFLITCSTIEEFNTWMADRYSQAIEWNAYVNNSLAQLISLASSGDSLNNYELKHELGRGGFGKVFLAEHKLTQRPFAIKFYCPAFHDGGGSPLSRFFQEASMLFDLDHPNIITVREVGLYQERPFIVMDYFEGTTLNRALVDHGSMPAYKAVELMELVASALNHAHQKDIVHRDLTPGNILLAKNDCRVIDFGLGIYIEQALKSRLTNAGGTPAGGNFTSRELLADPTLVDAKSDVYSIGALWYHAVTNDYPAGAEIENSLRNAEGLTELQREIILKCLMDSDRRYESCEELLADIRKTTVQEEQK